MSERTTHMAPSHLASDGVTVIDATECCGITQHEAFSRGEPFTHHWR